MKTISEKYIYTTFNYIEGRIIFAFHQDIYSDNKEISLEFFHGLNRNLFHCVLIYIKIGHAKTSKSFSVCLSLDMFLEILKFL